MNKVASVALWVAVAVLAIVTEGAFTSLDVSGMRATFTTLEGRIISVDATSSDQSKQPRLREAIVKLNTGETVRASVPGGCLVFPGQVTRLNKYGEGSGSTYMVTESGRDDS